MQRYSKSISPAIPQDREIQICLPLYMNIRVTDSNKETAYV